MIGETDSVVDTQAGPRLEAELKKIGRPVKVITYPGGHDHLAGKGPYLNDLIAYVKENAGRPSGK